jgi:hypothetical protein
LLSRSLQFIFPKLYISTIGQKIKIPRSLSQAATSNHFNVFSPIASLSNDEGAKPGNHLIQDVPFSLSATIYLSLLPRLFNFTFYSAILCTSLGLKLCNNPQSIIAESISAAKHTTHGLTSWLELFKVIYEPSVEIILHGRAITEIRARSVAEPEWTRVAPWCYSSALQQFSYFEPLMCKRQPLKLLAFTQLFIVQYCV